MKIPFSRTIRKIFKRYKSNGWIFSDYRKQLYIAEYAVWKKYYAPFSLEGKTILDVGAGEGETARFFIEQGAASVICIEFDHECLLSLRANARNRPITVIPEKFKIEHLNLDFDFMKMDIEGYEEALLGMNIEFPCVIEVHGLQLLDRFISQGYKLVHQGYKCWYGLVTKNLDSLYFLKSSYQQA